MSLADKALVIRVNSRAWTARRFDRELSDGVTAGAQAVTGAARVNNYLMAGADNELKAINSIVREVRDYIDANTVPWDNAGGRLITPKAWVSMKGVLDEFMRAFHNAVATFVVMYPMNLSKAQVNLGALYDATQFPHQDDLHRLFALDVRPEALPLAAPSDPRYGMNDAELSALRTTIETTVNAKLEESLSLQWKRLREEAERLHNVTAPRDGRRAPIFETTVEKLSHTARVLRDMNITDNAELNATCDDILTALAGVSAESLRTSATQRDSVHAATQAVLDKLGGF
jgi:hypothetical protein